ncbi:unnamed protein product [Arabidopsis thaliana]|uniref:Inositol-pentakisphosphate 2-kinase n=1 Tax=Arabidopsis thaliana TaxID=3702 RepID=A0A654EKQ7_ARATH|nr:unnamed protein product [Arabidopsis thaliana]
MQRVQGKRCLALKPCCVLDEFDKVDATLSESLPKLYGSVAAKLSFLEPETLDEMLAYLEYFPVGRPTEMNTVNNAPTTHLKSMDTREKVGAWFKQWCIQNAGHVAFCFRFYCMAMAKKGDQLEALIEEEQRDQTDNMKSLPSLSDVGSVVFAIIGTRADLACNIFDLISDSTIKGSIRFILLLGPSYNLLYLQKRNKRRNGDLPLPWPLSQLISTIDRTMEEIVFETKDAVDWSYRSEGVVNWFSLTLDPLPLLFCLPVEKEFLESVKKIVTSQRHPWRANTLSVDTNRSFALLMPKCGFLSSSSFIAEENVIKKSISRFEMYQVVKLRENQISQISEYDPLDLFSGSKDRIHKAIKALYSTPQNSLQVFLNDFFKTEDDSGLRANAFIELVAETVYASGALDQLLEDEKVNILKGFLTFSTAIDCSVMISFRPIETGLSSPSSHGMWRMGNIREGLVQVSKVDTVSNFQNVSEMLKSTKN